MSRRTIITSVLPGIVVSLISLCQEACKSSVRLRYSLAFVLLVLAGLDFYTKLSIVKTGQAHQCTLVNVTP